MVVDDGSTDGTDEAALAAASNHGLSIQLIRQSNAGVASARNAGIRRLRTDLVTPLDADDLMLPGHINTLAEPFELHRDIALSFGDAEIFDERGIISSSFLRDKPVERLAYDQDKSGFRLIRKDVFASLLRGNYVPACASMLACTAIRSAGGYDEALPASEDREFLIRLSRFGRFAYTTRAVARVRRHGASLTAMRKGLAMARSGFSALASISRRADELALDCDERIQLDTAFRESARSLFYHASSNGVVTYLRERRWARTVDATCLPFRAKDLARALVRTLYPSRKTNRPLL